MKTYDVIIIGAGPAGVMAARELEKNNVNYLVMEAKAKIGIPLRCGEITREDTFFELFNHTDYPFIKNKISDIKFRINDTQKVLRKNMFMLDKPEFLHWLAEPVKNKLLLNTKLEEIKDRGYLLEMVTSQHTYKTQLAVLANGANYKFQRDLGLVKKDVELVPCIGGFFENKTLHHNTAYFFYDADLHVASWIFPKEDNIFNAGAGMMLKNEKTENLNLKQAFKQSMEKLEITLKGEPTFGGRYVTSGPIGRTYRDRILVCGDAAGQVFAGIGEGIYFSLKAGQLAGQTAVRAVKNDTLNSEFLKEYEVNWNHSFGRQLDAGIILATDLFFLMNHRLAHNALKIIESKEIGDIWFNGKASFRLKLLYYFLKLIGCSLGR